MYTLRTRAGIRHAQHIAQQPRYASVGVPASALLFFYDFFSGTLPAFEVCVSCRAGNKPSFTQPISGNVITRQTLVSMLGSLKTKDAREHKENNPSVLFFQQPRNHIVKYQIILLLFILLVISCKHEYSFNVKNSTSFNLRGVNADFRNNARSMDIDSGSSTGTYTITYNTSWANMFADGGVYISVSRAIHLNDTLHNDSSSGLFIMRGNFSESKTNVLDIIKIDGTTPGDVIIDIDRYTE